MIATIETGQDARYEAISGDPSNQGEVARFAIDGMRRASVVIPAIQTVLVNPSVHPRFHPDNEHRRQAEWLADRFAKPLGLSRWEYMDRLPGFPAQPSEDLDIPVIVQAEVPSKKLTRAKILKILEISFDNEVIREFKIYWEGYPDGFQTPQVYSTYVDDGSNHINEKPSDVKTGLTAEKRMANDLEGLYLARSVYPTVLDHHYLGLTTTKYGSGYGADLGRRGGGPWLRCLWVDYAYPDWGSVVAGRNINVGNLFP